MILKTLGFILEVILGSAGLGVFDRSWLVSGRDSAACRRWRVVCLVGLPGRVGVLIINLPFLEKVLYEVRLADHFVWQRSR